MNVERVRTYFLQAFQIILQKSVDNFSVRKFLTKT